MEHTRKDVKAEINDKIHIIFLGDNHEGAKNHAKDNFQKAVEKIIDIRRKEGHQVIIIGLGDYIDCINHKDSRFNPAEIAEMYEISDLSNLPKKQMDAFIDDVNPIMDSFVAYLYGNHEESYVKHNGSNPMDTLKMYYDYSLNQTAPILGFDGWVTLGIQKPSEGRDRPHYKFKIRVSHGTGGGGFREGYPINKVHDIFRWDIADIYCIGHLHQLSDDVAVKKTFEYGSEKRIKTLYGSNGSFLYKSQEGARGYHEGKPGKYSTIGFLDAVITVKNSKRDCKLKWQKHIF